MRRIFRVLGWLAAVAVVLLLLVRFVGSPIATAIANRKLAAMPQFSGRVGAVKLALWRGTVIVTDLRLSDRRNPADGDIVTVRRGTLSLAWAPVFRGRLGGEGTVDGARIVMVKRAETVQDEKQKAEQLSKPVVRAWQEVLAKQFPLELNKLEITDSQVRFEDRSDPQVVSLVLEGIHLTAEGFSNRGEARETLPASVKLDARLGGTGVVTVDARLNAAKSEPTFDATFEVKGLSLPKLHDFLVRYALVDVASGEFELYSEVKASDGAYDGYTKPFFKNLEFKAVPDPEKSFLQRASVKVASVVKDVLKNDRDQIATKAPFHGNFADNKVDVWVTLENLLRNAFVQALREGFEGQTPAHGKG